MQAMISQHVVAFFMAGLSFLDTIEKILNGTAQLGLETRNIHEQR